MGFRATLIFRKIKVALNPMYRIFSTLPKVESYPAYQNLTLRKKFHRSVTFLKYKRLKLKLKLKLMIVASIDNEW